MTPHPGARLPAHTVQDMHDVPWIAQGECTLTPPGQPPVHVRYGWLPCPPATQACDRARLLRHVAQGWCGYAIDTEALPPEGIGWSYAGRLALIAMADRGALGVDATRAGWLDPSAWHAVLRLYDGAPPPPSASARTCAQAWTRLEAADKCLRTGLREATPSTHAARTSCLFYPLPTPPDLPELVAWGAWRG